MGQECERSQGLAGKVLLATSPSPNLDTPMPIEKGFCWLSLSLLYTVFAGPTAVALQAPLCNQQSKAPAAIQQLL